MNTAIVVLHALKDTCGLHCLVALHLAGPRPVTQQTLMSLTGFDDAAVHRGLHKLLALGLVACSGRKHLTAWELTPAAAALPLRLEPPAPVPVSDTLHPAPPPAQPAAPPAQPPSPRPQPPVPAPVPTSAARRVAPPPRRGFPNRESVAARVVVVEKESRERDTQVLSTPAALSTAPPESARQPTEPAKRNPPSATRPPDPHIAQLLRVFSHANVWPGGRVELARALAADDGPRWVRQALAWLGYAIRECTHMQVGAVVYPALRDRVAPAPEHLPPEGLDFAAALEWALRGGVETGEYANELDAGEEAVGSGQEAVGSGQEAEGSGQEADGGGQEAGGSGQEAVGSGQEADGSGQEAVGSGQEAVGSGQEAVGSGQPTDHHRPRSAAEPDGPRPSLLATVLAELQVECPPGGRAALEHWLRGGWLEPAGPGAWRLVVRDRQVRDWVHDRLRRRLQGLLSQALGQPVTLEIATVLQPKR